MAVDAFGYTLDEVQALEGRSGATAPWRAFARALLRRKIAVLALVYIGIFYFCGVFAPLIAPQGYAKQHLQRSQLYQGPSTAHLLGTDALGRDELSRLIYATRTTVLITVATSLTGGFILTVGLGMLAGYYGGLVDDLINRSGEALGSVPPLLVIILLSATLRMKFDAWIRHAYSWPVIGSNLKTGIADIFFVFLILSAIGWIDGERTIRSQVLSVRATDYVLAARSMGASTWRILWQHIFSNIRYLVVLGVTTSLGAVALEEITLSFFGLGVRDPTPSLGAMIFDGSGLRQFQAHPHLLLVPGIVAVLFFLSFALLGDALNDVLNPRTR